MTLFCERHLLKTRACYLNGEILKSWFCFHIFKKKVDFDEHHQWFINRVGSNSCKLLIVRIEEIDIGLVRVELNDDECEISIYLIPGYEGKGYGSKALALALDRCSTLCSCYKAIVQKKNVSSINLFKKLGFIEIYQDDVFATYSK